MSDRSSASRGNLTPAVDALFPIARGWGRCDFAAAAGSFYQISVDSKLGTLSQATLILQENDLEIVGPAGGSVLKGPGALTVHAQRTSETRGPVTAKFFANDLFLGTVTDHPYHVVQPLPVPGYYTLRLEATDARNVTTHSSPVPIVVRPANDDFADAQVITGHTAEIRGSNAAATMQRGEPSYAENQGGHSIWYRWTAPEDGVCSLTGPIIPVLPLPPPGTGATHTIPGGKAGGHALLLGAYVGDSVSTLSMAAVNAFSWPFGSPTTFQALAGTTYSISVDGFFGEEGETKWSLVLRPRNDDFSNRTLIGDTLYSATTSHRGATVEPGESALAGAGAAKSLWWSWTAPISTPVIVGATSDEPETRVLVFRGAALNSLQPVAESGGSWSTLSTARFHAEAGTTYQIAVLGPANATANFTFMLGILNLRLIRPLDGAVLPAPANLTLQAQMDGLSALPARVEFFANDLPVASVAKPPFTARWDQVEAGSYTLTARLITSDGLTYSSLPATILVHTHREPPAPRLFSGQLAKCSYVISASGAAYLFGLIHEQYGHDGVEELFFPKLAKRPVGVTGWQSIISGPEVYVWNPHGFFSLRVSVSWALSDAGELYKNGLEKIPFPAGVSRWITVQTSSLNALAVGNDGVIYSDGRDAVSFSPENIRWKDIGLGYDFSVTLAEDGRAFLHRNAASYPVPFPPGVKRFLSLGVASQAFLLLGEDAQLYQYGPLTHDSESAPDPKVQLPAGVASWTSFAVASTHALAIGSNGQLYAWGRNWEDQLGLGGGANPRTSPALVPRPPGVNHWIAVAAGARHSLALGDDCHLYAWGANDFGQLGIGPAPQQPKPVRVANLGALCGIPDEPPTISFIQAQTIIRGHSSAPIAFTVADPETPDEELLLSARSSNPSLVPEKNIQFAGAGRGRTLTIHPAEDQIGETDVTVRVTDAMGLAAERHFPVRVLPTGTQARILGRIRYFGNGAALTGVPIQISGQTVRSLVSGHDGLFELEAPLGGAYEIRPGPLTESAPARAITTLDVALVRRHILGIQTLDPPFQVLAGDVNGSSSITTLDIALMRRMILGIAEGFPVPLWRFVPSDHSFADPQAPWTHDTARRLPHLAGDTAVQDFLAIKLGDVNGSWTPAAPE